MKTLNKKTIFLFVIILFIFLVSCSKKVSYKDSIYYIDMPQYESIRQETISLIDTKYTDSSYESIFFGKCYIAAMNTTKTIEKQKISLKKEYGNIWSAEIVINGIDKKEKIYFHRLGDAPLKDEKEIPLNDEDIISAREYKTYKHVNYIIIFSSMYLI